MDHSARWGKAPQRVWHLRGEGPAPMVLGHWNWQPRGEAGWAQAELGDKLKALVGDVSWPE